MIDHDYLKLSFFFENALLQKLVYLRYRQGVFALLASRESLLSSNLSRYHRSPGLVPAISKRRYRE